MSAKAYRQLLAEWRATQLKATRDNVKRLEVVFDGAIQSLSSKVAEAGDLTLTGTAAAALVADLDRVLTGLRDDYAALLDGGALNVAQVAADRELAVARLAGWGEDPSLIPGLTKTLTLSGGVEATVQFSLVATQAVERIANRVYSDGWTLSDRLVNLDAQTREVVRQTLVQGVAEQVSAKELGKRLETHLTQGVKLTDAAGRDMNINARYNAMRIARTEINTAHREAHILSTIDSSTGRLKEWIHAVGWRLSLSHPRPDICDVWAGDDGAGLGSGNYQPDEVPWDHPHGLCYTISVLVAYPEVSGPGKLPNLDGVPEAQARYYAEKMNDPTARRWLENRGLVAA